MIKTLNITELKADLETLIGTLKKGLEEFGANAARHPIYALCWADDQYVNAAKLAVADELIYTINIGQISGEDDPTISYHIYQLANARIANPPVQGGRTCYNLLERETYEQWSHTIKWCEQYQ